MDILDSSASTAAHRAPDSPRGPADAALRRMTGGRPSTATAAAVILLAGFAVTMAAQILPWARISLAPTGASTLISTGGATTHIDVTVASFGTVLSVPYHLLWLVVFALGGATVFASAGRRDVLFGASVGAIAAQAAVLVALLKSPASLLGGEDGIEFSVEDGGDTRVIAVHTAGSYCVIVALAVVALAMIVAVEGRVLPGLRTPAAAATAITAPAAFAAGPPPAAAPLPGAVLPGAVLPGTPLPGAPLPGYGAAVPAVGSAWSSYRMEVVSSESVTTDAASGAEQAASVFQHTSASDGHDPYRRPAPAESYRPAYMEMNGADPAGRLTSRD